MRRAAFPRFPAEPARVPLSEIEVRCSEAVSHEHHYKDMERRGLQYGPTSEACADCGGRRTAQGVLARIEDTDLLMQASTGTACTQPCWTRVYSRYSRPWRMPMMPISTYQWAFAKCGLCAARRHALVPCQEDSRHENGAVEGDASVCNETGEVLVEIKGLRAKALTREVRDDLRDLDRWLYQIVWQSAPEEEPQSGGNWLIFSDQEGSGSAWLRNSEQRAPGASSMPHGASASNAWGPRITRLDRTRSKR